MDELDIYRSAKALIDQHGDDAAIHAAMRADELLDAGDLDGAGERSMFEKSPPNKRNTGACGALTEMSNSSQEMIDGKIGG